MSLLHPVKLHGHDPWVYLKYVLKRLSLHPNDRINGLLLHLRHGRPEALGIPEAAGVEYSNRYGVPRPNRRPRVHRHSG